jgi:hypothetical protein
VRVRDAIVLLTVLLVAGCKDKTAAVQPKPGSASAVAAPADAAAPVPQNTLRLPKFAGTPPVKTTKPIDRAKSEQLTQTEFEGFRKDVRIADDRGIDIRYFTLARPRIMVTVNASKCFDCVPMQADAWKAKGEALKVVAGPELKDRSDTVFAQGMTEIAGTPYAWTYHVGYSLLDDPAQGVTGAYGTGYAIYYNDGVNMIRVVAEYKDDAPRSREAMIAVTPREDLEAIAKAFVDQFVHRW